MKKLFFSVGSGFVVGLLFIGNGPEAIAQGTINQSLEPVEPMPPVLDSVGPLRKQHWTFTPSVDAPMAAFEVFVSQIESSFQVPVRWELRPTTAEGFPDQAVLLASGTIQAGNTPGWVIIDFQQQEILLQNGRRYSMSLGGEIAGALNIHGTPEDLYVRGERFIQTRPSIIAQFGPMTAVPGDWYFRLRVRLDSPSITSQPENQTVTAGGTAVFAVTATGTLPLSYQWRRNGVNIPGATDSVYTIINVQPVRAGNYSVVVSNSVGSTASVSAALVVNVPPSITAQPADLAVPAGSNATFTVVAAGTAPLKYQWRRNGVNIPGETRFSITVSNVQASNVGFYTVLVTNIAGSVTSSSSTLALLRESRPAFLTANLIGRSLTIEARGEGPAMLALQASSDLVTWNTIATFPGGGTHTFPISVSQELPAQFFRSIEINSLSAKAGRVVLEAENSADFGADSLLELDYDRNGIGDQFVRSDDYGRVAVNIATSGITEFWARSRSADGLLLGSWSVFNVITDSARNTARIIPSRTNDVSPGTINGFPSFGLCLPCFPCEENNALSIPSPTGSPKIDGVAPVDGSVSIPVAGFTGLNLSHESLQAYPGAAGNGVIGLDGTSVERKGTNMVVVWFGNDPVLLTSSDGVNFTSPSLAGATGLFDETEQTFTLSALQGTHWVYTVPLPGEVGPIRRVVNSNGDRFDYGRNDCGNLVAIRHHQHGATRTVALFEYTSNPHLKTVTDRLGRKWEFFYDSGQRLIEIASPATEFADIAPGVLLTDTALNLVTKPRRTTYAYGDPVFTNHITSITDERGVVVRTLTYDAQGRVSTQTINGHTTQYIYEPTANPTPLPKLEAGNILTRVIDPEGNIVDTEIMGPGQTGQFGIRRRVTWTESGKGNAPLRVGEPLWYAVITAQDCNCLTPAAVSQPFSSLDAPSLNFGADGIPQNWPHTRFTYNGDRQVLTEVYTDGTETIRTEMTYQASSYGVNNQFGKMLTRKEPRAFDGNPIYAGLNFVHAYEYDAQGNMTKHIAPTVTRGVVSAQAVVETWTYNTNGQVLTHTDPNGNITINTYHNGPATGGDINTKGNFFGYLASVTRGATGSADSAVNLTTIYLVNALGQVTRMIDPMGHEYDTEYNDLGKVVRTLEPPVTLRNGPTVRYETRQIYDGAGNVVMTRRSNLDYLGQLQPNAFIDHSMSYDAGNHRLAERREVDANDINDVITTYAYDQNDQLIAVQKPKGNRVFSVFDERLRLLKQFIGVEPGASIVSGYPADKRATDLGGTSFVALTRADYDSRGNVVTNYDGRGNPIVNGFDFRNRQIYQADQNRNGWVRYYDDAGNVLATEQGAMPGANGVLSRVLARSYARIDEVGRQYQAVQDFNPATSELSAIDPAGADNSSFLTRFDPGSRTVASFDANGNVTTLAYDAANRRATVTDALSNSVTMIYDPNSNVKETQETELPGPGSSGLPQTFFTTKGYDPLNRPIETHVLGLNRSIDHRSITSYDSRGNAVLMQDAEDRFARSTFDDLGRLIRTERFADDPVNAVAHLLQRSEFQYDKNSRTTADIAFSDVTNPASAQTTQYFYDHADRRVREVYPDSEDADDVIRVAYDPNGNPIWVREQRGVMFTNIYDPGNRLTDQFIALPPSVPGTSRQSFGYDALNRLTNAANNYAQVGRAYDSLSRQTNETQSIRLDGSGFANGWEQPVQVACVFDKQANNTGCIVWEGANTDLTIGRTIDPLNRVDTMSAGYFNTNRPIVDYNYYGPGRIQSKTLGNGARLVLSHDAKRRVQIMLWLDPVNLLAGFEHGFDKVDNVTSEKWLHDGGRFDHYGYNKRDELINVEYRSTNSAPPAIWRDTFAYDDNYNRTNAAFGGPFDTTNTVTDTYGANRVNEYTNITRNGQAFVVQHDRAGNMTQFPVRPATTNLPADVQATARWDAFNLLYDIENPATGKQHYRYDTFRRRIAVLDSETSLQGSRRFIFERWSDIEERVFTPGATLASAPSTLERIYVEGPRIDEHLLAAIDRNGDGQLGGANLKNQGDITADQEYFYLQNRLGSTIALSDTDNTARILEYTRYSVYGEATVLAAIDNNIDGIEDTPLDLDDNALVDPRRWSEEFGNPCLFTGRRFDEKTGLYYYRHRLYEARSGRFVGRDILWHSEGGNPYGYVQNAPFYYVDPFGLYRLDAHLFEEDFSPDWTVSMSLRSEKKDTCSMEDLPKARWHLSVAEVSGDLDVSVDGSAEKGLLSQLLGKYQVELNYDENYTLIGSSIELEKDFKKPNPSCPNGIMCCTRAFGEFEVKEETESTLNLYGTHQMVPGRLGLRIQGKGVTRGSMELIICPTREYEFNLLFEGKTFSAPPLPLRTIFDAGSDSDAEFVRM